MTVSNEMQDVVMNGGPSVESLYQKAVELYEEFKYDLAIQFLNRIQEIAPKPHLPSLTLLSSLQIEEGLYEEACETLKSCMAVDPKAYQYYVTLAQLCYGQEALSYYDQGLQLLLDAEILEGHDVEEAENLKKSRSIAISSLYCSMAELYLTDLCDEPDADKMCLELLDMSLRQNAENYEALLNKAHVYLSLHDNDTARKYLNESMDVWDKEELKVDDLPSFEFRISTVKCCIELEELNAAQDILLDLVEEDEDSLECWYLLSIVYFQGEVWNGIAEPLQKAKKLLAKMPENLKAEDDEVSQMEVDMNHMIQELESKGITVPLEEQ